jgi:hypothetical protein
LADGSIKSELTGIYLDGKLTRVEKLNPSIFSEISNDINVSLDSSQRIENDRLKLAIEEAKLKQAASQEKLRLALQQTAQPVQAELPQCTGSPKSGHSLMDAYNWTNCKGILKITAYSKNKPASITKPEPATVYEGEFSQGYFHGNGTLRNEVFTYTGEFYLGYREGKGLLTFKNGQPEQEGIFLKNVFLRPSTEQNLTSSNETLKNSNNGLITNNLEITQANQTYAQISSKRLALVMGNANYKTRPLRNPRNDADDVSNVLKATGFQVIDLRDASIQQMRAGVRQFGDRLINNDVGLVYYSGHGVEVKGRNYFIPVNADIMREDEIADQGLDVSLILEKMNTAGKGVNILIVDACRDDPFGRSFRSSSRGLAQMDAPRGTIIAYATSPGKVASDGDPRERNSPYTKNLVKAMQQPNKPIEQVFKEVRRAVQEETKNQQTPWENTSLSGDFYFKVQR